MSTSLHPITNWPTYNKSLINRGSLTFWVDAEAMSNWFHHDHHGRRGRSQLYKQLIGPTLSLRNYNAQVGEILAGVKVMNKLIGLGMPVRQPVN